MPRNRIIYQCLGAFVSQVNASGDQTVAGSVKEIHRVQSFDDSFTRNFIDINQFNQLAAIDRIEVTAPTVNGSYTYYPTDGSQENIIGLTVWGGSGATPVGCLSGILNHSTDERNYYLALAKEGEDLVNFNGTPTGVVALGNSFITSYQVQGQVGQVVTATVNLEALNWRAYANINGPAPVPAVVPANGLPVVGVNFILPNATQNDSVDQPTALRPGDILLDIDGSIGVSVADLKIQSFTLNVPVTRTALEKLGSRFPFSREVNFPLNTTLSVNAQFGDLQDGNLSDLLCETGFHNLQVRIKRNSCSGDNGDAIVYSFLGAKLDNENFTNSIGQNSAVALQWTAQVGGPKDLQHGVFISGSYF